VPVDAIETFRERGSGLVAMTKMVVCGGGRLRESADVCSGASYVFSGMRVIAAVGAQDTI